MNTGDFKYSKCFSGTSFFCQTVPLWFKLVAVCLNTATQGSDDLVCRRDTLKWCFDGSRCCLFSELVIYKCFKPFKAFLIRSFYIIMYFCCIVWSSSAILLRPTKNITVDLSESLSFNATIIESSQLTFNHCFNFRCRYEMYMTKPEYDR